MALLIAVNGKQTKVAPKAGRKFDLHELQGYVGGYVTEVRCGSGILLVDEDGNLKNLPLNEEASRIAGMDIVGPALLCKRGEY